MANRPSMHPHLPYNVLDTTSLTNIINNNNNNPVHDSSLSSSASCTRRIISSVVMSTTTTPTTSSCHCHCLRIYSLRHDPVHFIPALFAELNLPPPASIWTTSIPTSTPTPTPTDDYPPSGFGIGSGIGYDPNSRALWFVYHDALAVRFPIFIFFARHTRCIGIIDLTSAAFCILFLFLGKSGSR
jgi:hypothetical protein